MTTIETTDQHLTANVVAAFLTRNDMSADAVPGLITSVFGAFQSLGSEVALAPPAPEPAVSVKASVKPDHLVCLCCGKKGKMLKRHLATAHGLTPEAYRAMWDLPAAYPMVAAEYADRRRVLAVQIGLGRKPKVVTSRKKAA